MGLRLSPGLVFKGKVIIFVYGLSAPTWPLVVLCILGVRFPVKQCEPCQYVLRYTTLKFRVLALSSKYIYIYIQVNSFFIVYFVCDSFLCRPDSDSI